MVMYTTVVINKMDSHIFLDSGAAFVSASPVASGIPQVGSFLKEKKNLKREKIISPRVNLKFETYCTCKVHTTLKKKLKSQKYHTYKVGVLDKTKKIKKHKII